MTALSYRSPLIKMVMSGKHYDVKVDPVSLRRLIAWVDAMGPYRGEDEIRAIPDPEFDDIEELAIRPRTRTAPRISRPSAMQLISQRPRSRSAKPRCTVERQPGQ